MGEIFYVQEIYPKEFQFWKETGISKYLLG